MMQSFRTTDPDEASSAVISSGFLDRLDIEPLGGMRSPTYRVDVIPLGGILLTTHAISGMRSMRCCGGNFLNFIIHKSGNWDVSSSSSGRDTNSIYEAALMQPDGLNFNYHSERFSSIGVSFHIPSLQYYIEVAHEIAESQQVIFDCIASEVPSTLHNIRSIAQLMIDDVANGASLLSLGNTAEELEQIMYAALLSGVIRRSRSQLAKPPSAAAPRQVVKAEQYIREFADKRSITLSDLAAVSGVSARALHNGFQRFRGMSPMAYLRRYRMQKVREALLAAGQDAVVAAEAARWGFLQPGRFAVEYRKMYGESPSQTIQQTLVRRPPPFIRPLAKRD